MFGWNFIQYNMEFALRKELFRISLCTLYVHDPKSCSSCYTHSVEIAEDPDFAVVVVQMILDVIIVFHVGDDIFFRRLFVLDLELIRALDTAYHKLHIHDS